MILIDDYDWFANRLMFEQMDLYRKFVFGVSCDPLSSPIRSFLETINFCKAILPGLRLFMTDVTPIALSDASSVNFIENISQKEQFGDILGFSQSDIERGLQIAELKKTKSSDVRYWLRELLHGYYFVGTSAGGLY